MGSLQSSSSLQRCPACGWRPFTPKCDACLAVIARGDTVIRCAKCEAESRSAPPAAPAAEYDEEVDVADGRTVAARRSLRAVPAPPAARGGTGEARAAVFAAELDYHRPHKDEASRAEAWRQRIVTLNAFERAVREELATWAREQERDARKRTDPYDKGRADAYDDAAATWGSK